MKAQFISALLLVLMAVGCTRHEPARQEIPAAQGPAVDVIVVTPTKIPTLVPTAIRFAPTETPSTTLQARQVSSVEPANCAEALERSYAIASDKCLEGPTGYFCNGGHPPMLQPRSDTLAELGSLVPADGVDSLHSPAMDPAGGGLVWLRLKENIRMDALLVGDVHITNLVSPSSTAVTWRSLTIESSTSTPACYEAPATGALIVQGLYGQSASLVINGVSATINGTLIALTQADSTKFLVIEGQVLLIVFGNSVTLNVGQQLNLPYAPGDWTRPLRLPGNPVLLERALISNLPVVLFDRPVPIPQPGFAQTQGGVNMRAAPDINSRLLFQVPAGETMGVLGISSDSQWLHIRFGNGETGWMSAELLARSLGQIKDVYDLTPEPPQRYGVYAWRATVNVSAGGNLREAPDTAFRVKRTLPYSTEVKLLARSPYSPWVQVEATGEVGWMALFTLETESVISSLPIDYDVPLPPRATATPSFSYGGGHAYPDPSGGY